MTKKSRRNDGTFLVLFVAYGGNAGKERKMFTELYYEYTGDMERVLPYILYVSSFDDVKLHAPFSRNFKSEGVLSAGFSNEFKESPPIN